MKQKTNPPVFLIDYSASMDKYLPELIEKIDEIIFPHSTFFFSESIIEVRPKDIPQPGKYTDITNAILEMNALDPSAVVLFSDGNHNWGESPILRAVDLKMPIYCFGIGDETQKDISIIDVQYPEYAYKGDSVKIEVVVESKGFKSGNGEIWLGLPKRRIRRRGSFPLSDAIARNIVEFWIQAIEPGQEKIELYVTPQSQEETHENNRFGFSLYILDEKIKTLYYTDHLSFNTKFILKTLSEDNRIELKSLIKMNKGIYLSLDDNQKENTVTNVEKFDVLILDNVDLSRLPYDIDKFLRIGKGILCMGIIEGITDIWYDILPINVAQSVTKGSFPIEVIEPFSCLKLGDDYPPLSLIHRVIGVKDNTVILAQTNQFPIIAYRKHGDGMVFQINAIDIGTWQFLQVGLKQKDLLLCLMSDIVRFISPAGQKGRLILKSMHRDYGLGETVNIILQSFDRDFRPAGRGDFFADIEGRKIPFFEVKEGIYEATFVARSIGKLQIRAAGKFGEEMLSSNDLEITISPKALEMERGLNRQLLQTLSEKTGGRYYSINELASFELLQKGKKLVLKRINFNSPMSYFIIFILFAIDWYIRKKRGTI